MALSGERGRWACQPQRPFDLPLTLTSELSERETSQSSLSLETCLATCLSFALVRTRARISRQLRRLRLSGTIREDEIRSALLQVQRKGTFACARMKGKRERTLSVD